MGTGHSGRGASRIHRFLADGRNDIRCRFNRRQIENDRPALAERHKPLDAKPHGGRIAILRHLDNRLDNGVAIVLEQLFSKLRNACAGTPRFAARVAALTFGKRPSTLI
jgi:hypothetical protein